MPDLSDFEELDLTGMDYEDFDWQSEGIDYDFGDGYGASILTSSAGGRHGWRIFSGCLPNSEQYNNLIDGLPRWQYYFEFFKRHRTTKRVFEINFDGKRYHAAFVDRTINPQVFSYDLFGECTLAIKQQKVPGIVYDTDNSILEIENIPGLWSWHRADTNWNQLDGVWADVRPGPGADVTLSRNGVHILTEAAAQNGKDVMRLNAGTADSFFETFESPTFFDMFLVMKVREATFSANVGLVTADATVALLKGSSGTTKFENIAIADFEYRLNGVEYAQSNQQAPMNTFGVVHLRALAGGLTIVNMQFGKDRGTAGSFAKEDLAEIVIVGTDNLSEALYTRVQRYLAGYWGIS